MSSQHTTDGRVQMPHRIENEKKAPVFKFPDTTTTGNKSESKY